MAYRCECCDELFDGEAEYLVITRAKFTKTNHGVTVEALNTEDWCEGCAPDNSFYCHLTDERYSDDKFGAADDEDGDTVCEEAAVAAGWIWDNDNYHYRRPTDEEQTMAGKYVDFYWQLDKGERHGVLQVEDGGEEPMSHSLEEKIYHRIEEAGADKGDPKVVNVYTRLQLIDDGLLPKDYTL